MRTKKAWISVFFVMLIGVPLALSAGLGIQTAQAVPGTPGPLGTRLNYGYFKGGLDPDGSDVLGGGIFSNTVDQFVADIWAAYTSGNINRSTGASFIINTMLGRNTPGNRNITWPEFVEWESRVRSPDVMINFTEDFTYCINSYWQDGLIDDAFYDRAACWRPTDIYNGRLVGQSIVFRNRLTGQVLYAIRRVCGNPVGFINTIIGLPEPNFDMSAAVITRVNGVVSTSAEAGDTISITYIATNNGPGTASGVTCQTNRHDYVGYHAPPGSVDAGSTGGPPMGCPGTFNPGQTVQIVETVTAVANSTMCRFLTVAPQNRAGGSDIDIECVVVHTKPYFKVYGGDAASGASFTPCGASLPAGQGQIQAFNKGAAGNYAGSGAEVAAFAYRAIDGFVSADMRSVAPRPPVGLTFANTAGTYGGDFGSGRCIPDYWALSGSAGATIHTVGAGNWPVGATTLGAGARQDVFVDGDAFVTGNVAYIGSWALDLSSNTIPSFRLIVRGGNIYIRDTVTQLDGVYVAIPRADGSKGIIYTCALAAVPPTELQVAAGCKQQLRVNGAFIAKNVKLLRTPNSLGNAVATETSAATRAGEIFTYTPEMWLANPQFTTPTSTEFDSITSLPPVL